MLLGKRVLVGAGYSILDKCFYDGLVRFHQSKRRLPPVFAGQRRKIPALLMIRPEQYYRVWLFRANTDLISRGAFTARKKLHSSKKSTRCPAPTKTLADWTAARGSCGTPEEKTKIKNNPKPRIADCCRICLLPPKEARAAERPGRKRRHPRLLTYRAFS